MKRKLLVFCLFISVFAIAQEPQKSYELNENITGTKEYVARDHITLKDGFSYTASEAESFSAIIDQHLLFPPTDATYGNPDGAAGSTASSGGVVGSIPGKFDVSPTGAATYTIPIEVPKGINGMEPDISLNYNSQTGNGIAGWGWSIGGLSKISRAPRNLYFDNEVSGIDWTKDSPLMLDGQRLIKISESGDEIEYKTESESFRKIIGKNIMSWGPQVIEVHTKDGKIFEYGNMSLPFSYFVLDGYSSPQFPLGSIFLDGKNLGWGLTKVTDSNGNFIEYVFTADWGGFQSTWSWGSWNHRIKKIIYGANYREGTEHFSEIDFEYESRVDPMSEFVNGEEKIQRKRLQKIIIKNGSSQLRSYNLEYRSIETLSVLKEVNLISGNKSYNSTTFETGKHIGQAPKKKISRDFFKDLPSGKSSVIGVVSLDFAGDGVEDIGVLYSETSYHGDLVEYYLRIFNKTINSPPKQREKDYYMGYTMKAFDNIMSGSISNRVFGDFFNNGAVSALNIREGKSEDGKRYLIGLSFVSLKNQEEFRSDLVLLEQEKSANPFVVVGDFNDDISSDVLVIRDIPKSNEGRYRYKATMVSKLGNEKKNFFIDTPSKITELYAEDFNGDGKDDLFLVLEEGNVICENIYNGASFFSSPKDGVYGLKDGCLFELGHLNSDQNADIVYRNKNGDWKIAYSKGDGSFLIKSLDSANCVDKGNSSKDKDNVFIVDVNQDGLQDIVLGDEKLKAEYSWLGYFERYNYKKTNWQYFIQKGRSFELFKDETNKQRAGNGFHFFGDYDNYGAKNWLWISTEEGNFKNYIWYARTNYSREKMISEIKNGLGQDINIYYKNLAYPSVYQNNVSLPSILQNIRSSYFPVVSSLRNEKNEYELSYQNCVVYPKGKGLLGFLSMKRKNINTGIVQESKNTLNTTFYTLVPHIDKTMIGSSSKINQTTQDITLVSKGSQRYWARTNSVTKTDLLKNTSVKQIFNDYDSYGNPKNIKTEYLNGGSNSGISETKEIIYTNTGPTTNIKPKKITLTKTNENGSQTRINRFAYDEKGNLTRKTRDVGDDNELVKTYTDYDAFGNPGTVTESANGKSRSTSFEYSASGRFLEKETDDFTDFSTTYNYNETTALLTSETDHLGLTTEYEYDGFGRLVKTTHSDGTYSVKARQWAGGDGPDNAIYYTYEETSGESPVWTWYDGLGRELRTEYYGFDTDKKIRVDKKYNPKGRVESVSKPYFANGDREWAESYTYDNYGRTDTKTTPMGTTTMAYDGLTTTITTPRSVKVKTENAAGQTVSNKVDGRTVTFSYYPSGKVKTATPQGGKSVEMFYNTQGNRTKITDPDAGVVETTYNGFGELISEAYTMGSGEDERTVTTSYTYDGSGRLVETDRNGKITDYKHKDSNGFLESISNSDHKVTYTYDEGSNQPLGRPTTVKEQIEGKEFIFKTSYDAFGREQKHTYPSGFYIKNSYTKYGHLQQVKGSNGKSIWKGEEANALGQFVKTKKGGKISTFGYDDKDRPENIYSPGILDHFYKFNDKGNLESREDRLTSQEEIFTYEKHQLKTWKIKQNGSVASTFSMDYDEHGNITGKSDLGYEMEYNDERPHAISGIDGNPSLISDKEQTITYTDFKKIAKITEGDNSLHLTYGIDDQRRKGVFKTNGETSLTRYYLNDYEEEQTADGKTRKIHYLSGGNGVSAIHVEEDGNGQLFYAYTDYLGSLTALTDAGGNVKERQAFDPWGNRREPNDWTSLITTPVSNITGRGYTMHEHLDEFSLINMNGRVYDSQIARFLSPDPQLQAPGYWLNYNRYGYCYNNPMIYTDPSGEWILETLAALTFSYLKGAKENRDRETDKWQWNPTKWYTPIEFGVSTNSSGSNFSAMASVGGQPVLSSEAMANSGNGNYGAVSGINDARGAEFYSRLTPRGALRDLAVFPSLRTNYQMHGVDVDMRTGSLMFDDSSIGYDYMWNKSFYNENGRFGPAREVSGWAIKGDKTIVMPYYKNTIKKSYNSYQNIQGNGPGLKVKFNGVYYPVKTHVHTHPDYYGGDIGLTGSPQKIEGDYQLLYDLDLDYINVIYNNKIHKAYYDFYNKQWDFLNVWTW